MVFVKILTSLIILFVAVNLILTLYGMLNRKQREGLGAIEECPGSYCMTYKTPPVCHGSYPPVPCTGAATAKPKPKTPPHVPAPVPPAPVPPEKHVPVAPRPAPRPSSYVPPHIPACRNGCTAPTGLSGNCNSLEKDANGNYYKDCPYECTGEGCQYDQQCSDCGEFKITGLWDKTGDYIGSHGEVHKTGGYIPPPSVNVASCDVLAIHNNSAHSSTYGRWFPTHISTLNLGQSKYEHAGRKFLNEESVKNGIQTPLVLGSEAEVLGRLLWKVHLAAITQNCMNNSNTSVKTTMRDELELMKKVHQIQHSHTKSSISGTACSVNSCTQPKQTASCSTTGLMTNFGDNRPGVFSKNPSSTNSLNSNVPHVSGRNAYSSHYKPRDPNKNPKAYDSIWDIF